VQLLCRLEPPQQQHWTWDCIPHNYRSSVSMPVSNRTSMLVVGNAETGLEVLNTILDALL
jgi:hypothetical protein